MKRVIILIFSLCLFASVEGQSIIRANPFARAQVAATPVGNMISNGTFASSTDWSVDGGWTIAGGFAVWDDATDGNLTQAAADMNAPVLANTAYTLTFDVSGTTGDGMYFGIKSANSVATYKANAQYNNGSKTVNFTTPADISVGGIRFTGSTLGESGGSITNLVLTAD